MQNDVTCWLTPQAEFRLVTAVLPDVCMQLTERQQTQALVTQQFQAQIIGTVLAQAVLFKNSGQLAISWLDQTGTATTVVETTTTGQTRAYTTNRDGIAMSSVLKVVKNPRVGKRSDSHIPLTAGSPTEQLTDYFTDSEQAPTWCHTSGAQGWLLQALPGVTADRCAAVTAWYQATATAHPDWQLGDWQAALTTFLGGSAQAVATTEVTLAPLRKWDDYRDRLRELPLAERRQFFEQQPFIEVTDPYANATYRFDAADCGVSAAQ